MKEQCVRLITSMDQLIKRDYVERCPRDVPKGHHRTYRVVVVSCVRYQFSLHFIHEFRSWVDWAYRYGGQ